VPKFSLPRLSSGIKKAVMTVVGAGVLGGGGWMAWDTYMAEPPPVRQATAKPKPKRAVEAPPEVLVEELLRMSGVTKSLDQIPGKVLQGAQQSSAKPNDPAAVARVEEIMQDAFRSERFHKRVQAALLEDFEHERVESLLTAFRAPLTKKLVALESAEHDPQAVASFIQALNETPLPATRMDLVRRLDAATRAGEVTTEIVITTTRAMVSGATGGDAKQMALFDERFSAQRATLDETLRNVVLATYAYIYRDVSDADLGEYVELYEGEDGKWLMQRVTAGMIDEFRGAGVQAGERIAAAVRSSVPQAVVKDEPPAAAAGRAMASAPASEPAPSSARLVSASARIDARECLQLETNLAIHRCAEKYR